MRLSINLRSYFKSKDKKKLYYVLINGKSHTTAPSVYELNTQEWFKVHRFLKRLLVKKTVEKMCVCGHHRRDHQTHVDGRHPCIMLQSVDRCRCECYQFDRYQK